MFVRGMVALVLVGQLAGCSSSSPTTPVPTQPPPPPPTVVALARTWRYDGSFVMPLYLAGTPDSLRCALAAVALTFTSPTFVQTRTIDTVFGSTIVLTTDSWSLTPQFSGGSISCTGDRGESISGTPAISSANTSVLGYTYMALDLGYTLATPVGTILVCHDGSIAADGQSAGGDLTAYNGLTISRATCANLGESGGIFGGIGTFTLRAP